MYRTLLCWRRRNDGKFCYNIFDEYSKFSRTTLVLIKRTCNFLAEAEEVLQIEDFNLDVHAFFIRASKFGRASLFLSFCTL